MNKSPKVVELKEISKNRYGRFYDNGVKLEAHEYSCALLLTRYGITLEAIKPANTPGASNPDFLIKNKIWEAKSPDGTSERSIKNNFHKAGHQAQNLIMDLRRSKLPAEKSKNIAVKEFKLSKRINRMILIAKDERIIEYKK